MEFPKIEIKTDGIKGHIIIDGIDMSNVVRGYTLVHRAGEVPTLSVELLATDLVMDGESIVDYPKAIVSKKDNGSDKSQ